MKKIFTCSIILLITSRIAFAQGCSDAGFCSVGNLSVKGNSTQDKHANKLKLSLISGVGDENVFVFTPSLEYLRQINSHWEVQAKLTGNYASGDLASVFGAGDLFLTGTYLAGGKKKWKSSYTLGTKLPLNQGTLSKNGLALPMQYQSSLGTVDLIAGISVYSDRWQFNLGFQQPLTGTNGNQFLPQYWNTANAFKFPPTNDFNRKGDVLLRTAYTFQSHSKVHFNVGLLGIYHLGSDTYIDAGIQNKPIQIKGSEGLTINMTGLVDWEVTNRVNLSLTGGFPLMVRDVRPDGLTRRFVVSPQLSFSF